MEKRLTFDYKFSNIILIYYSIFLIIHSLTAVYFDWYNEIWCEYFSIVGSIVMLAGSILNGNANYSQRITKITESINQLKALKRNLDTADNYEDTYNQIVDNTEFRSDIDFFRTVICKCKKHGINAYFPDWQKSISQSADIEEYNQTKNIYVRLIHGLHG